MSTIKKIKIGTTAYDIVATDSDKLGGKLPSDFAPATSGSYFVAGTQTASTNA